MMDDLERERESYEVPEDKRERTLVEMLLEKPS